MVNAVTYKAHGARTHTREARAPSSLVRAKDGIRCERNKRKEYSGRARAAQCKENRNCTGTPENRRNKVFARAAQKMVHGSRGVEIKRRYCFFRRANANGKIVAWTRKWNARSGKNGTLLRINARFQRTFHLVRGAKGNELHVTDQKICTRVVACSRGPQTQITSSFTAPHAISRKI